MYTAKGNSPDEEQLVTRHAPLVKRIAYHLLGRLPSSVMVDDLMQAGMIGLLDAARHYDQSQGASFETYASIRVRGAMLDELRRNDWAPKSVHRRARDVAEAVRSVESRTGRDATDQEVAREMGIALAEYHQILQDASTCKVLSFEEMGADQQDVNDILADGAAGPLENVQQGQFVDNLSDAIELLPERERLVVSLYYDEELNLKEIGAILKVSESRVSQLLSQAHARLRARLGDWLAR